MTADFKELITELADHFDWDASEVTSDTAQFVFQAESGNEQTIFLTLNEDVVEFDIPSSCVFDSEEEVDDLISTRLMKRNAELALGAWVLEEIDDQWCFSFMWNLSLSDLEKMDPDEFCTNVGTMVEECDAFDRTWQEQE